MTSGKPFEYRQDIIVTGAQSMIGHYLKERFQHRCIMLSRDELDISEKDRFASLLDRHTPKAVINSAGNAGGSREDLFKVNALYPAGLAEECEKRGIAFYFLSSARVFGHGHNQPFLTTDHPSPVDDYGIAKYTGELLVRSVANGYGVVVRLPMVLGGRLKYRERQVLFRLLEKSLNHEKVSVASDVIHSPIHADDAVSALVSLIDAQTAGGIYHVSGRETVSLYDLYNMIVKELGCDAPVTPVNASEIAASSLVPLYHALQSSIPVNASCRDAVIRFVKDVSGALAHA